MKEYLKNFIFFMMVSMAAAIVIRIALPRTFNVRVIGGDISTKTSISGAVNADVSGSVNTETKVRF